MKNANHAEWQATFSVGNDEIDAQHRLMLDLLNHLYDALYEHQPRKSICAILDEAGEFATVHFATEERLMAECCFPGLEEHRDAHETYRRLVKDIRQRSKEEQGQDLFFFLKEWWLGHLLQVDVLYATWLKPAPAP